MESAKERPCPELPPELLPAIFSHLEASTLADPDWPSRLQGGGISVLQPCTAVSRSWCEAARPCITAVHIEPPPWIAALDERDPEGCYAVERFAQRILRPYPWLQRVTLKKMFLTLEDPSASLLTVLSRSCPNLRELSLIDSLSKVPDLSPLSNLSTLELHVTSRREIRWEHHLLPAPVPSLLHLTVSGGHDSPSQLGLPFPNLLHLPSLESLTLHKVGFVELSLSSQATPNLWTLKIHSCPRLYYLDFVGPFSFLHSMEVTDTPLQQLVGMENLASLEELTLRGEFCIPMSKLVGLEYLLKLRKLAIKELGWPTVATTATTTAAAPTAATMAAQIEELDVQIEIDGVGEVECDLASWRALHTLTISVHTSAPTATAAAAPPAAAAARGSPPGLVKLRALDAARSLERLTVDAPLEDLPPEISSLSRLQTLKLSELAAPTLPAFGEKPCLEHVSIRAPRLASGEALAGVSSLVSLELLDCRFTEAPGGVEGSRGTLRELSFQGCDRLRKLPDLSGFHRLRAVDFRNCTSLKLPPLPLAQLTSLLFHHGPKP